MNTEKTKQIIYNGHKIGMILNMGGGVIWDKKQDLPGPKNLIGGSLQAGFYGETPTRKFITGDELARHIGLSAGKSQFSNEAWLKFSYLGNIEYVAKKPFRRSISWNDINAVNAVFGNRTIEIKGHIYILRLIKGKNEGKQHVTTEYGGDIVRNSEWNRLMLPIHKNAPSNWRWPYDVESPTENWRIGYTNDNLGIDGSWGWCQDYGEKEIYRLCRGTGNVSHSGSTVPNYDGGNWRPVLELVR